MRNFGARTDGGAFVTLAPRARCLADAITFAEQSLDVRPAILVVARHVSAPIDFPHSIYLRHARYPEIQKMQIFLIFCRPVHSCRDRKLDILHLMRTEDSGYVGKQKGSRAFEHDNTGQTEPEKGTFYFLTNMD